MITNMACPWHGTKKDAIAARKEAEERYYPKTIKEDNYECKS